MSALPVWQKQPGEIRTGTFRFIEKLAAGDTLTGSATITITPATPLAVVGTASVDTPYVNVRLSGGTNGVDYNVQCAINTTGGDKLHLDVTIEVREGAN